MPERLSVISDASETQKANAHLIRYFMRAEPISLKTGNWGMGHGGLGMGHGGLGMGHGGLGKAWAT
ncbi:hypothetical protein [Microcoleus sp. FACHB-68]|uniref:hypothetical protein n=1 Tax=Microcoleus sp. FACHB-68 TaxID=2692826 RepID=UPI001689618B|nr:hypothetical protein [Microcoleus sp. FACHB-68]MBD1937705.1 hypothetical protein [Microcoleus sp. FACHB-68]